VTSVGGKGLLGSASVQSSGLTFLVVALLVRLHGVGGVPVDAAIQIADIDDGSSGARAAESDAFGNGQPGSRTRRYETALSHPACWFALESSVPAFEEPCKVACVLSRLWSDGALRHHRLLQRVQQREVRLACFHDRYAPRLDRQ